MGEGRVKAAFPRKKKPTVSIFKAFETQLGNQPIGVMPMKLRFQEEDEGTEDEDSPEEDEDTDDEETPEEDSEDAE